MIELSERPDVPTNQELPEIILTSDVAPAKPSVLETAGKEAKSFLSKTAQSLMKHVAMRVIDLIAPGLGTVIHTLESVISAVETVQALAVVRRTLQRQRAARRALLYLVQ